VIADQPDYMRDYVSPQDFEKVKSGIEAYKQVLKDRGEKTRKLADEYRRQVEDLQREEAKKLELARQNDLVFIWSMSSSHLPLDRQVDIVIAHLEKDAAKREALQQVIDDDVKQMKIQALKD